MGHCTPFGPRRRCPVSRSCAPGASSARQLPTHVCPLVGSVERPMTPISEHPPVGATLPGSGCAGRDNVRPASVAASIPVAPRLPCTADAGSTLPLDLGRLLRRCMGRVELAERLLASFQRMPIEVAQIQECLAASDLVRLAARPSIQRHDRQRFGSGTPRHRRTHGACRTSRAA